MEGSRRYLVGRDPDLVDEVGLPVQQRQQPLLLRDAERRLQRQLRQLLGFLYHEVFFTFLLLILFLFFLFLNIKNFNVSSYIAQRFWLVCSQT